jgi:putative oxidoreductase
MIEAPQTLSRVTLLRFGFTIGILFAALRIKMFRSKSFLIMSLPTRFFRPELFGKSKGEGFECHLLAITIALAILIQGSGAFSIDRLLTAVL